MSFANTVPVNDIVETRPEFWRMYYTDYPSRDEVPEEVLLLRTPFSKYWNRTSISPSRFSFSQDYEKTSEGMRDVWAAAYVRHAELLDSVAPEYKDLGECLTEAARRAGVTPAKLIWNVDPDLERQLAGAVLTESQYRKIWLPTVVPLASHIDVALLRNRYSHPSSVFIEHGPTVFSRHILASDSAKCFTPKECAVLEAKGITMETALAYEGLPFDTILTAIEQGIPLEYALSGSDS